MYTKGSGKGKRWGEGGLRHVYEAKGLASSKGWKTRGHVNKMRE